MNNVSLHINANTVINYALWQNKRKVIQEITVSNQSGESLEHLDLHIHSEPEICVDYTKHIDRIAGDKPFTMRNIDVILNAEYLAGITEKRNGTLHISLEKEGEVLGEKTLEITALCYDEWHGSTYYPELLASFMQPNHPEVTKLISRASYFMEKWTKNPSLDGYQSQDINRVLSMAGAVYATLQELNIVYALPPASFEEVGQRVRLCDAMIQQKMGTCLDMTLLYCSCLEAMGINTLLILKKGHIFAGLWLEDKNFPEEIQDDATLITKRLADGINEIAVVECTAFASGKNITFDKARLAAENELVGEDPVEYIIDVKRARISKVVPLPSRVQKEDGWFIDREERSEKELTNAPKDIETTIDVEATFGSTMDKKTQWERKLLDMSMRNSLINLRLSRKLVPIWTTSLDDLEDSLSEGKDYIIRSKPAEWEISQNSIDFENINVDTDYTDMIRNDFKNGLLRSPYTETELENALKDLYRQAKTSLEESGANTLYLAMGLLRWFETDNSKKARYAPIILLPVDIVRKSVKQGYLMRLRDEDAQMNITILEKMKQDHDIQIEGLDPLPKDGNNIDVRKVLTILRKAFMSQTKWDVLESAYLGIFSFSQFVMWNDIRNRSQDLAHNKVVKSLMDGMISWDAEPMEMTEKVSEDGVYLPISADASQLFAIREASEGKSFVLHGPPGTGKSQTITALIANALTQGKTVLFVAEKMAALEVVQKRLGAIGLDPFCLELHSNKARKRSVLDQLQKAISVKGQVSSEDYEAKAAQLKELREELDAYARDLHSTRDCGWNVYELINLYEQYKEARDIKPLSRSSLAKLTKDKINSQNILVERMVAAAKAMGSPSTHPLKRVGQTQYSQNIRQNLENVLEEYSNSMTSMEEKAREMAQALQQEAPFEESDYQRLASQSEDLIFWSTMPRSWADKEDLPAYLVGVGQMIMHYQKAFDLERQLGGHWKSSFLYQDGKALLEEYEENEKQWFLPKFFGSNRFMKKLSGYSIDSIKKEDVLADIQTLIQFQKEKSQGDELFAHYGASLSASGDPSDVDWNQIREYCIEAGKNPSTLSLRKAAVENPDLARMAQDFQEEMDRFAPKQEASYLLLDIREADKELPWIEQEKSMIEAILSNKDGLKEWITWNYIAKEAEDMGLAPLVQAYGEGLEHEEVMPAYYKAVSQGLLMEEIDQHPALGNFSGAVFQEKISQLKRLDDEMKQVTKEEIFCRLAARVPDFTKESAKSSEVGILQRAIHSNGRGVSLRTLFEMIPNLLPRLCPCMLMSPISVAQYLATNREVFDLVVFDEASQLPTCKAVGALARGKEAVIVGDPKQMPPTNFFMSANVDEENMDLEDLDSILDDCLALNMPQTYLLWHYRSRHESLIAFSNQQFYENKLYTFPSSNDLESRVNLVKVDGTFDKGKTRQNRVEAQAVVDEIKHRCHDPELSRYSLGVVTFNINQQNLIDDLLIEACREDLELETWINREEEPLFIKNLENVQGDERDVILFSVGYGPDQDGKVSVNFGPLNRDGGWRRLNVAVSRARTEMKVFSSMTHESINLSRTSAQGVAALKAFLKFAEDHTLEINENTMTSNAAMQQSTKGISDRLCKVLKEHGYTTQQLVGDSQYRIDIGVVDPENPGSYLLGILLDGPQYGNARTTRDRELAQISVLRGLGWNITRLWSMDWWDNANKEINRILGELEDLLLARQQENCPEEEETLENNSGGEGNSVTEVDSQENDPATGTDSLEYDLVKEADSTEIPEDLVEEIVENQPGATLGDITKAIQTEALPEDDSLYKVTVLDNPVLTSEQFISTEYRDSIRETIKKILEVEAPITETLLTRRVLQSYGISRGGSRIQENIKKLFNAMEIPHGKNGERIIYWDFQQDPQSYREFRKNGKEEAKRELADIPQEEIVNAICQIVHDQISLEEQDLAHEAAKAMGLRYTGNVGVAYMSAIQKAAETGRIHKDQNGRWMESEQ